MTAPDWDPKAESKCGGLLFVAHTTDEGSAGGSSVVGWRERRFFVAFQLSFVRRYTPKER